MPRTKKSSTLAARDTYHVVGPSGSDLDVKGEAPHALVVAQGRAERWGSEVTLTVERRSLFGPSAMLYRVDRTSDGMVYTTTTNAED